MEYIISIVLSSLILAAVIVSVVLIFVYLKKSKATTTLDLKEIGVYNNKFFDGPIKDKYWIISSQSKKRLEQTNKTSEMSNEIRKIQTNITEFAGVVLMFK